MKEEKSQVIIEDNFDGIEMLKSLERKGRICYKSEHKITENSYIDFLRSIITRGHESVLEHEKISVRVICDRGVSHQIVRHRLGSYSQESTRYCNYSNDQFGQQITVIKPTYLNEQQYLIWKQAMQSAENCYFQLLELGSSPQEARTVLPTSLKTEIVITYNLREWRHFLKVRTLKVAHPQMREIALNILNELKQRIPIIFDDIMEKKNNEN